MFPAITTITALMISIFSHILRYCFGFMRINLTNAKVFESCKNAKFHLQNLSKIRNIHQYEMVEASLAL